MMIAGPIGLGALALWWWGAEYLAVDVPADVAHMVTIKKRVSLPLDQLGPLSIVEKSRQGLRNRRIVHYELMAAGLPDMVVFSSHDRAAVDQRRARIEQLIATSAVRRILATAVTEPGAFRAAPDLAVRVRQTVTDPALLEQALAELARDHDARVRAGAAEVASGEHR